jgi:prophage regulatory protein
MSSIKRLYVDLSEAAGMLSLAMSTVQRLVREKQFPAPRQISAGRVGWLVREIEDWAETRPVSDLPPPPNTGGRKALRLRTEPAILDAGQAA